MDLFFITVSFVFILFIILSYYIGIIRISSPLVLIYLVFCFSYFINQGFEEEVMNEGIVAPDNFNISAKDDSSKENAKSGIPKINNLDTEKIKEISKPIVSFNPKPIIIDSNLTIKRNKEKIQFEESIIKKDEINVTNEIVHNNNKTLKLKEIMICRGVYKRNPIKPGFKFTNNVDSLFCYTKISNSGTKQEIKHVWYFQDKLITSVVYNIKTSYNYRSWSKKNISPSQIGKWRVDIIDSKDFILGSREFEISSLNDLY